jgi:RNA polymerase sigma-70 factor (ECF subfamily)
MQDTSAILLKRLRQPAGKAAWESFVRLYTPLLGHWARQMGLHGPDVEDLVQDVFTLLVRKLPAFRPDPRKRFQGWLWVVTTNKVRERWRRRARVRLVAPGVLEELPGREDAEEAAEAEDRECLVRQALEVLRSEFQPSTWRAFWECAMGGRQAPEVATELGLSVGAVYAAKSRVFRRLRREVEGLLNAPRRVGPRSTQKNRTSRQDRCRRA